MWRFVLILSLAAVLVVAGCASGDAPRTPGGAQQPDFDDDETSNLEDIVSAVGTVRYVDLEGGFYGIETDAGVQYLPQDLPDAYQQDGMRVRFRARILDEVMTVQMWGQPVRLLDILEVTVDED